MNPTTFKEVQTLADIRPAVANKKEIRFATHPNGVTMGVYMFMDNKTFDSVESLECRGIAFDADGKICSRPLHKFFNVGEKEWLSWGHLESRAKDLMGVFEKLDGSMLATAWVDGQLAWRSKKSFDNETVALTEKLLAHPRYSHVTEFANKVAKAGITAIFELTHPEAQIVVEQPEPAFKLLHLRDNVSGEYLLLNAAHEVNSWVAHFGVEKVEKFEMTLQEVRDSLETMKNQEGYILQFSDGDMVKVKCPWYLRLHRSVTFLRERDIALAALHEDLDDIKSGLSETKIDLAPVLEVESRLKARLIELYDEIEKTVEANSHLDKKAFALTLNKHPLFGLMMAKYSGKDVNLKEWFERNRLKEEFGLRALVSGAAAEALND